MKQKSLLKTMLLLFALIAGSSSVWAADPVTIASFTMSSSTPDGWSCNAEKQSTTYYKMFSGKTIVSPSISFSDYKNIKIKIKARKLGGPTDAQKVISVYQGTTSNVLTSYDGPTSTSLVYSSELEMDPSDGTITVACLGASSDKGCGISEVLITGEEISSDADSEASFDDETPSIDLKDQSSYTQLVSTAAGYNGTITYSMTSNSAGASINETTGVVTPTKAGSVTVKASLAAVVGTWAASSATYTLTVSDTRDEAGLEWSLNSVNIAKNAASYSLPSLTNPHSVAVSYTITGTAGLASESAGVVTVDTSIEGSATVKASYAGGTYKPAEVSYTITVYDPDKKGTIYKPYTVAEIIAINPTSTSVVVEDVYVTGYIIGVVNSSTGALINTNISSDTNLALADDPTETEDFISAQLPSGTIRTALNIKSNGHPYYLGCAKVLMRGDVAKYCGRAGIKNVDAGEVVGQKIKVTSVGLATYCTDVDLKFDGALEAYIAKEDNGTIKLQQVTNVPANTGMLLRAEGISSDTYFDVNVTDDAADDVSGNLFKQGNDANVASGSGPYNYILNVVNDKIGFYRANGKKVAKNRAYLQTTINASTGAPDFIDLNFGGETTGIELINGSEFKVYGEYYNLNGQRIANPTKGLYIVNGKKVVIK